MARHHMQMLGMRCVACVSRCPLPAHSLWLCYSSRSNPGAHRCAPCASGCAQCQACGPGATLATKVRCIPGPNFALRCTRQCADPHCTCCPRDASRCQSCGEGFYLDHGSCRQYLRGAFCPAGVQYCDALGERAKCLPCHEPWYYGTCVVTPPRDGAPGPKQKPACAIGSYRPNNNGPCVQARAGLSIVLDE